MAIILVFSGTASGQFDRKAYDSLKRLSDADHRYLMKTLNITSLRNGPSGDPKAADAANTDEAKANNYSSLPDALVLNNGAPVRDAGTWWGKRRPEIMEDFDREIYGRVPGSTPRVSWKLVSQEQGFQGGVPVTIKRLVGHVDNSSYREISVQIELLVTTPSRLKSVPLVIELGFNPPRGPRMDTTSLNWKQQLIDKGWGYAILNPYSIQADNGAGLLRGIIGLCNKGERRSPEDWGALRAWAWGAARALDYLQKDRDVNAKRVGIEGVSRFGKAALVAMAYDQRFAVAFVASSGQGGAKLMRRNFGEQVENVASSSEYHWMAGNYLKYAGPLTPADLPVDAHQLIGLCAPRPVFISVGSPQVEGNWIDARGMFISTALAGPVYELLGKKGVGSTNFPKMETLLSGDLAFRQHSGGHTAGPNWKYFIEFASPYFTKR